jgi:hypothetical protein
MALDTSGVYSEGDDYRVIKVLNLPFGSYTLDCVQNCLNQLEDMSVTAATDGMSGPAKEKAKIEDDVRQIMSFCSCLGNYLGGYSGTSLIRS